MEKPIRVVIDTDRPGAMINANIYGNFTEHLGTLVYNGIWVGPDSPIPNVNGIRSDVITALKKIKPLGYSMARRMFRG